MEKIPERQGGVRCGNPSERWIISLRVLPEFTFLFSYLSPATTVLPLLDIAAVMIERKAVLTAIVLVTIVAEEGEIDAFPTDCTVGIERGFLLLKKFREEPPDFPKDGHYRVSTMVKGD